MDDIPRDLKPNDDGYHDLTQFFHVFKNRELTQGEIKIVFRTADVNSDKKVSPLEWNQFWDLFVNPFQILDIGNKYLADEIDIMIRLEDEFLSNVDIDSDQVEDLCTVFDRFDNEYVELGGSLNFADYLFLRKANLAWTECTKDKTLGM